LKDVIRTFIAIEIPEDILAVLDRVQTVFKKYRLNIRWVRPESIHLTLKFLGDIRPADVQAVSAAVTEATSSHAVFELHGLGIGVFPHIRNPRVFWAGIGGDVQALQSLQTSVENCLSRLGFEKERRPFKGHLTFGRSKGKIESRRLMDAMADWGEFSTRSFSVKHVTFFQSDLQSGGAIYTRLATLPLVAAKPIFSDLAERSRFSILE
jgi:2'-5' RNA ligase